MSEQVNLTLFQRWILLQLFNSPGTWESTPTILINCCDTALTPELLEGDGADDQLQILQTKKLIDIDGENCKITSTGILYTRINLLKPITDITDLPDFDLIFKKLESGPLKDILDEEYVPHDTDKKRLSGRIRAYAIEHMAPYAAFLNNVISITKQVQESSGQ